MKNNKSIYIVGIFMLITMVSIGYAILTGQLNINGTAKVKAASWNIYFKNIKIKDGSVTASVVPAISNKTTVNFEVDLNKPGDFYEFNVDVVNDGDLDAMIESISITPELTLDQQKYLSYSVTYLDGVAVEEKDILHANKARTLKIRVEYKKNIENNDLVSNDEIINIKATIKYVQADATAKESLSSEGNIIFKLTKITGDGTQVGDELAIGDEHFYVISNDGENITMLAKHNLLVGNQCPSACTPISNPTGIQDSSAIGWNSSTPYIGTVPFSTTGYWYDSGLKSKYGNSYPAYVYDENSAIYEYLNSYEAYLKTFKNEILEVRLISSDELVELGCNLSPNTCNDAPEWVYSSTYWSGSLSGSDKHIWYVSSFGDLFNITYSNKGYIGVRPVIVVPASSI